MNIPLPLPSLTLMPSAIIRASLPELGGVNPSAAPIGIFAQPDVVGGATMVDLSKLGQLLSASAMLQLRSQKAGFVDAVGEQDASANLDDGFGKLLAAAQFFIDAFNQFQSDDANPVQGPLRAPFDNVLLLAINSLPAEDSGKSLLSSLEQVGIGFQDASSSVGSAPLRIDVTALQYAFNANPARTSALLAQAFQTIGQLAAKLAGQNVDLFVTGADQAPPARSFDVLPVTLAAASPPITVDDVDTTLQRSLADQALRDALDANPAPAAVVPTVDTVAPAGAPPLNIAPMQAAGELSAADQVANPIASVGASFAARGAQAQVQAPVTAPVAALDDGRAPLALDPSVAAAVAAYRLGDGALAVSANKPASPLFEPNGDINAVDKIGSVALDPHDGSSDARRNETARNAALALAENKALAATPFPSQKTVDVMI